MIPGDKPRALSTPVVLKPAAGCPRLRITGPEDSFLSSDSEAPWLAAPRLFHTR